MKTSRSILLALLTSASLLAPAASQAETIFERFAPPLPPLPHIVIRSAPAPVYREVYREDHYYRRPPARYYYERHDERRHSRHSHRRDERHDGRRDNDRHWR